MKLLLTLDEKNYTDAMPVLEKYTVRGIIAQNGRYAMQRSSAGEYKIPGGGVEPGENRLDALHREVREETGLLVDLSTVEEMGEILELREDLHCPGQKYICHSLFYSCEVLSETVELEMTESEKEAGFHLEWAPLEEIIKTNRELSLEKWKERDTLFLQLLQEGRVAKS
jgi:8-oxo-dGTP pyrophosphatase MutT (NUDIX family)